MRLVMTLLLLLIPFAAQAAEPVDGYLATRDAYLLKFKLPDDAPINDKLIAQEKRARADLEKQLRRIVGPLAITGFATTGKINLDTLISGEMGYGLLDGLVYEARDRKSRVIVTTEPLLAGWMRTHEHWWEKKARMPQDVERAFKWGSFYTQAMSADAAVDTYAELPVRSPKAKVVVALLVARTQDIGPATPDEVIVAAVQGGRVFVVSAPAAVKVGAIAACDQIWADALKNADAKYTAYQASDPKDEKLFDEHTRMQDEGAAAFGRCFNERAKTESFFAALTRQAQAIVDRLP
jgi:hypothetical protein